MNRCPFCRADLPDTARRCDRCGERVDELVSREAPAPAESALSADRPRGAGEQDYPAAPGRRGGEGHALPPFPASVFTAGVLWIVCGGLGLLQFVVGLLLVFALTDPAPRQAVAAQLACNSVFWLTGGMFVYMGRQTVRGKVGGRKMTLNGILSMAFGLAQGFPILVLLANADRLNAWDFVMPAVVLHVGIVLAFFVAGLLAVIGAWAYLAWRQAHPLAR